MKKASIILLSVLLLAGCSDNGDTTQKDDEKQITTDTQISKDYYRTLLPFKESQARGLTSTNMASSYNGEAFESGLLEISKKVYSPEDYYYRDGQLLTKEAVKSYLEPQFTKKEIAAMDEDTRIDRNAYANFGLNPSHNGETDPEKIAQNSPAYLSHILEQDFYTVEDAENKKLSGMTIGLAMNSVYDYQKEPYGEVYSKELNPKVSAEKGKEMADEILSRLRVKQELKDIPITFAIFIQSSTESITPGHFVAYSTSEQGDALKKWEDISEDYILLPSPDTDKINQNLNNNFKQFNESLNSYFPNFTQAIGTVHVVDGQVKTVAINIPLEYFGKAEVIGVTQHIADQSRKYFDGISSYEISVVDNDKPLALITKERDGEQHIHIYEQ
ncbi:CamS family sex pheromone protein [Macrococcus carouselicus]|uniref:CamS family sex pheromone protein n=1 Tax=Macrococcus carouselicus TaxID=69969 RepID=A0A9Q8CL02_9STAP|nr:CamS family sex pheromone protein [Macrococcus carouselicus]TDM00723.1 CamS family sex pheromone protein [Macrococcus carouselicus]